MAGVGPGGLVAAEGGAAQAGSAAAAGAPACAPAPRPLLPHPRLLAPRPRACHRLLRRRNRPARRLARGGRRAPADVIDGRLHRRDCIPGPVGPSHGVATGGTVSHREEGQVPAADPAQSDGGQHRERRGAVGAGGVRDDDALHPDLEQEGL
eukprot:635501-Rhodomonas_salina.4